jgi:hypothetical protein
MTPIPVIGLPGRAGFLLRAGKAPMMGWIAACPLEVFDMPSPFPGMDPFIEDQEWSDFHPTFAGEIRAQLAPKLEPRYYVRIERRVYVEHPQYEDNGSSQPDIRKPDVSPHLRSESAVLPYTAGGTATLAAPVECFIPMPEEQRESFLKIHETETREVVTVLEVLSPSNKRPGGDGRREYLQKRDQVFESATHLVELDLLRGGARLPMQSPLPPGDYYAIISKSHRRPRAAVYPWLLLDPLPTIPIPLLKGDDNVPLDLRAALTAVYDRARYHLSINYTAKLEVPLPDEQAKWLSRQLARHAPG